jgi:hypothetical protein
VAVHNYTQTIQIQTEVVECCPCPVFVEFYSRICLTTEENARKNLSQVKKNLSHNTVYILPKTPTHYKALTDTHITKPTHTHTTKQYKTTTVQIKTKKEKQFVTRVVFTLLCSLLIKIRNHLMPRHMYMEAVCACLPNFSMSHARLWFFSFSNIISLWGNIFSVGYYVCGVLLILLIKCGIFHVWLCSYRELESEIITV